MAGRGSAPGERRGGREKGTPNKITRAVKEAIEQAAEIVGDEFADAVHDEHPDKPRPEGGVLGYCCMLARSYPKEFAGMMGKLIPTKVDATVTRKLSDLTDEHLAAIAALGAGSDADTGGASEPDQLH